MHPALFKLLSSALSLQGVWGNPTARWMQGQSVWPWARPVSSLLYTDWLRDGNVTRYSQRRSDYLGFHGNYPKRLLSWISSCRGKVKTAAASCDPRLRSLLLMESIWKKSWEMERNRVWSQTYSWTSQLHESEEKDPNWYGIRYKWGCLADITLTYPVYIVPIIHEHGSWSWDLTAQLGKGPAPCGLNNNASQSGVNAQWDTPAMWWVPKL